MAINKTQRNFIIAFIIGLLIYFLVPEAYGLTHEGVGMLAVFIPTIFIWLVEGGSGWSALFAVSALVMLHCWDGVDAYKSLWGGSMVAMIIPYYMMANALERSGAVMWVVRWVLSRKIVHKRPVVFTALFMLTMVFTNIFINTMVSVVVFFKVLKDLALSINIDRDSKWYRAHGLLIAWVCQISDGCLIWGRPFILSMVAIIVGLGFPNFTMNDFFHLSILYLLFVLVITFLIVYVWIRPNTEAFMEYDDEAIREELKANPMTKNAKVLLIGMVFVIIAYVSAFLTPLGAIQQYFNSLPVAAPISLMVAIMALLRVDGKPALDIGYEAARVPWNTVLFLGSVMFFGGIIGNEAFGISAAISAIVTPIVANLPTMVTIVGGLALASVMTNLTSNAVSCMVVLSCFVPAMMAAPNFGQSQILAFCTCVVTICATAIATLAACATMSLVYCPDGIEYKGTARYSIALCLIMVLVCSFILIPIGTGMFAGIV